MGLWVGGFMWCAWVAEAVPERESRPERMEKSKQAGQTQAQVAAKPLSQNFSR